MGYLDAPGVSDGAEHRLPVVPPDPAQLQVVVRPRRFSWEDVMFQADDVRQILVAVVDLVRGQAEVRGRCRGSA